MGDAEVKRVVEAEPFRVPLELGGIPVVLQARIFFLTDGKIAAVRSLRLLDADGTPFNRVDSGKYADHVEMEADAKEQVDG